MRDKLTDAIRTGIVSSINPDKCMAKVTFKDRQDTVSRELHVLVPFTSKDKAYYMPVVGERVMVIFDPVAPSKGYILGSFYSKTREPPYKDENKRYVQFEDGTLIEYDKKLHSLTIKITESGDTSVNIETASDINISSKGKISIMCEDDLTLGGKTSSITL